MGELFSHQQSLHVGQLHNSSSLGGVVPRGGPQGTDDQSRLLSEQFIHHLLPDCFSESNATKYFEFILNCSGEKNASERNRRFMV